MYFRWWDPRDSLSHWNRVCGVEAPKPYNEGSTKNIVSRFASWRRCRRGGAGIGKGRSTDFFGPFLRLFIFLTLQLELHRDGCFDFDRLSVEQRRTVTPLSHGVERRLREKR